MVQVPRVPLETGESGAREATVHCTAVAAAAADTTVAAVVARMKIPAAPMPEVVEAVPHTPTRL
jgi:hypothetical protein